MTCPTAWQSLIEGKSGIDTTINHDITADPNCKVSVAGEVKDFDPTQYMEKSEVRKTDLYAQYAMAPAVQAMNDSGIEGKVDGDRLGVYVGSGIGGMNTFMTEDKKWLDTGMRKVSPYFIPMLISNIASGNIAFAF